MPYVLIGVGGFVGAVLRHWVGGLAQNAAGATTFPVATLAVNILGCLGIGVLAQLADARSLLTADMRALLVVGLLGGFTTFSAFANETVNALRAGAPLVALVNVLGNVSACLLAVWAGRALGGLIWK